MQGQCLCSPFSSFFPKGLGWIQGSDAPAAPIQLISSTSRFSSSFSIPFTTSLIVLPLSVFLLLLHFHFSFGSVISALSIPEILILCSISHHYSYFHCPSMFPTDPLFLLHPQFDLILFHSIPHTHTRYVHSSFHRFVSPDYVFSHFQEEEYLKSGRGRAGEEKSGEETRLPRARGTAYPYQTSTCLLDPPGHTALFI